MRLSSIQESIKPSLDLFDISVRFSDYKAPKQGENRISYSIAEISFDPESTTERSIRLEPVPKSLYPELKEKMVDTFVQMVTPWLLTKRQTGWEQRYHALRITYDATKKIFVTVEHNAA